MNTNNTGRLNDLFKNWEKQYGEGQFVQDGIINEEFWTEAPKRVLFVLKEPTEYRKDLREFFNKSPWPLLGYWAHGLHSTDKHGIPTLKTATNPVNWPDACRSSAVMNLKKSPGGSTADIEEIRKVAHHEREFILREIEIIGANIVVCGGLDLFEVVKEVMPFDRFSKVGPDEECFSYKNAIWIRYAHPSARKIYTDMMYYTLMVLYQNCLKEI